MAVTPVTSEFHVAKDMDRHLISVLSPAQYAYSVKYVELRLLGTRKLVIG